jgi:hypothetical protein
MGFVMDRGKRSMSAMRYGVLRHLDRVRHHVAFEIESSELPALERWARDANAILFHSDGTVRAPDGKVLVDPGSGEPEPGAALPYPADAVARKAATDRTLDERGIRVLATIPPCGSELEVELREPRDVATRVLALFVCAARAESLAANEPLPVEMMQQRMPLAFGAMSPRETAFMAASEPAKQDVIDHVWRYEALLPLAWSVGLVESLPFPTAICDVASLAKTLFALDGEAFVASARLRPIGEILDVLDQTFRLHWVVTNARVKQTAPPAELVPGAVAERHHALNWLTRFADAEWDAVPTPT